MNEQPKHKAVNEPSIGRMQHLTVSELGGGGGADNQYTALSGVAHAQVFEQENIFLHTCCLALFKFILTFTVGLLNNDTNFE